MSALRLTPAAIFVLGVAALLQQTSLASAQESSPSSAGTVKSQPQQPQPAPIPAKKSEPKRNQGPLPAPVATEATPPVTSPGCGWIGKRVIHSLLRDDAVTAQDFDRLYHTFNCSPDHLRAAFDCTAAVGALPTAVEAQTRVDSCWTDPKFDTKSTKMGPASETSTGSSAAAVGSNAQPKSGAGKGTQPAAGATVGSTPNYPNPAPR